MAKNDYFDLLNVIALRSNQMKDIFSKYDILNDTNNFIEVKLNDNDTLLKLAQRYYKSKRFWWIIALYSDIIDPFYDMPLSEQELRDYASKYLDEEAESGETFEELYTAFTTENETKRTIHILSPTLINEFLRLFRKEIQKIKSS